MYELKALFDSGLFSKRLLIDHKVITEKKKKSLQNIKWILQER